MYQFSRSVYRELAPRITGEGGGGAAEKQELLEACEATFARLASDYRHFAHPTETLFREVRDHFPLRDQIRVYIVIQRSVEAAIAYIESLPKGITADGRARQCAASTRQGTPCRRQPRPGREFCPSHSHLEELFETA
jgi:hypothetical protein